MNRILKFALPTVGVLLLVVVFIILRNAKKSSNDIPESKTTAPKSEYGFLNIAQEVEYVGDEECAVCHSDIYRTFKQTGMGRSFYLPTPENVIEDYSENNIIYDPKTNLYYQMYQNGNDFYQLEYRLDEKGQKTHKLVRKVDFIVGSGNHNRTYLTNENSFLFEMPVTWYSEKKIWDLSPGYHTLNLRFSRPIVPECMNCHNSYANQTEYSENRYSDVPLGIGCERCHGPGELHVEKRYKVKFEELKDVKVDSTIVNPKHLSLDLQIDVCRQCHLQGEIRVLKEGRKETAFRPGMRLTDVKSVFIRDQLQTGDFRIASHGARISRSTCFTESGGKLVCTYCHNPHKPVQWLSRTFFNERCLTCHELETLSQTNSRAEHHRGGDCVACHMRQGATADILHVNFTDHWIRKEIKLYTKSETDSLLLQDESDAIVMKDFFAENDALAELRLGIAYVKYFEAKHRHTEYLERAIPLLESGLRDHSKHQNGLYYLATAYIHLDRLNEALVQIQKLLELTPNNSIAHFQSARILQKRGSLEQAIEAYQTSIKIFPDNAKALNNLGNVYSTLGKKYEAINYYEMALQVQPSYALAYNNLGDLYAYKLNDFELAKKHFELALRQDPDLVTALHNIGNINLTTGNEYEALNFYQRAIEIDSNFVPAYGNLAVIYGRRGNKKEAMRYLNKILEIDPQNISAQNMLKQLENSN